ncbi:MAG: hypothetical protein IKR85_08325 [Clostridia bacterium]|nr:hypothetical protein [Clostridia bacterium]
MNKGTRSIAISGIAGAIAVVIMLAGYLIGAGTYASPMLAGFVLIAVGLASGRRYQLLAYISVSLLCVMLVREWEENLMFICLFGWYPMVRTRLQKLPAIPRACIKQIGFNLIIVAVEALVMRVLAPETESAGMLAALLVLANVLFVLYDMLVPKMEKLLKTRLKL